MSKVQEEPFDLGKQAALAGKKVSACPYDSHSSKYKRWYSGWQAGRIDAERLAATKMMSAAQTGTSAQ